MAHAIIANLTKLRACLDVAFNCPRFDGLHSLQQAMLQSKLLRNCT